MKLQQILMEYSKGECGGGDAGSKGQEGDSEVWLSQTSADQGRDVGRQINMLYWGSEEKKDEAREMLPVVHTVRHNVRKPRFKPHSPLRAPWLGHFACPF